MCNSVNVLSAHLKMVQMINFMLCVFYHNLNAYTYIIWPNTSVSGLFFHLIMGTEVHFEVLRSSEDGWW